MRWLPPPGGFSPHPPSTCLGGVGACEFRRVSPTKHAIQPSPVSLSIATRICTATSEGRRRTSTVPQYALLVIQGAGGNPVENRLDLALQQLAAGWHQPSDGLGAEQFLAEQTAFGITRSDDRPIISALDY